MQKFAAELAYQLIVEANSHLDVASGAEADVEVTARRAASLVLKSMGTALMRTVEKERV